MILFDVNAITEYILSITPAISALVAVIVVVAVGVGKVKNALNGNVQTIERTHSNNSKALEIIVEQNKALREENKELKKALIELNRKIDIIDTIKAVNKE